MIRVLLVGDQILVCQGLRLLLEKQPDLEVAGEAGTGSEALELTRSCRPDIVLLDLDMSCCNSMDLLQQLVSCNARVIILTVSRDPEFHHQAFQSGAMGLITKHQTGEVLIRAIGKVHGGEAWMEHKIMAAIISGNSHPQENQNVEHIAALTKREREVIAVVCEGWKNRQIAKRLFVSEATIRNHITSILAKLGLSDRFELALYSYRHGLAKPPGPRNA